MRWIMIGLSKATSSWAGRICARLTIAFCLVVFSFGGAVERGLSNHLSLASALTLMVSGDVHVDVENDGAKKQSTEVVDHGCHGCPGISHPLPAGAASPIALGERIAWTSVPSTDGREPLIDLPPPRA